MSRVLDWDGQNVPYAMWSLPPGRYVIESVDDVVTWTPEEEAGIREAIASVSAGQGLPLEVVRERVLGSLKR